MNKRLIFAVIIVVSILACISISAFAQENIPYVWENFSEGVPDNMTNYRATIVAEEGGLNDGKCISVSVLANSGTPYFPITLKQNTTYTMSVWIKMKNALPLKVIADPSVIASNFAFMLQVPKLDDAGKETTAYATATIGIGNVEYSTDEYIKYTTSYTYTGTVANTACGENALFYIRIANGYRQQQGPSFATMDFYMDDLKMYPISDEEQISDVNVRSPFVGKNLSVSCNKSSDKLLCDISSSFNDDWVSIYTATDDDISMYVDEKYRGNKLKVSFLPINDDGTVGKLHEYEIDEIGDEFDVEVEPENDVWNDETENLSFSISAVSNNGSKNIVAILCQYSEDNEMLLPITTVNGTMIQNAQTTNTPLPLSAAVLDGAVKARVFTWEGVDEIDTLMSPFKEHTMVVKQ